MIHSALMHTEIYKCASTLLSMTASCLCTRFLQHGLGLLAHMILTHSQAYIRPPAYPKEEVNLSTLHEEWGVNTAPQEIFITFSPLLSISSAKQHQIPAAWIRTSTVLPIHKLLNMWVSIAERIQRHTCMQHQIPAAWIGTASPHDFDTIPSIL